METELLNQLNLEVSFLITGWISIIAGLLIKDILGNLMYGLMFYFDKNFNEGDVIYLNGSKYIIVKNGIVNSVFLNDKEQRWTYIRNNRLQYLQIEKDLNSKYEQIKNKD